MPDRRAPARFLISTALFFVYACEPASRGIISTASESQPNTATISHRDYVVVQQLVLNNAGPGEPEKQNLWVALIRDLPPYQEVTSLTISPDHYQLVTDEYANHFAEFDFSHQPSGSSITVEISTRVRVNELSYDLSNCAGALPDEFVQPELHIESENPQIVQLAQRLAAPKDTACEKVRAFYDYVGDHLVYTYNGKNWGAQAALGPMGADCTEYSSLLIALSRAQGIPARYFEGLRYLESGAEKDARVEHAWADVYLPATGWVALDPTLGRYPQERATYFAHYTPDHIIVTMGVNPSTLRGSSYWTHLYWPGNSTTITVAAKDWKIELAK